LYSPAFAYRRGNSEDCGLKMKIVHHKDPYYSIAYDFYTGEELAKIWHELERLNNQNVLTSNPEETSGAYEDKLFIMNDHRQATQKRYLKLNYGKFLDDLYATDRNQSAILTFNQKVLRDEPEYKKSMMGGDNPFSQYLFHINYYATLLNYYEQNHYYAPHIDSSCLTAISYFWKEPRLFDGGDLSFSDYPGHRVDLRNNSLIVFPSFQRHDVSAVDLKYGVATGQLNGRFAISQFLSHNFVPKKKAPVLDATPSFLEKIGILPPIKN
jgi:Rps23 Pro-64 3,4-dihydroxylase Tpa1-like proline 4-hydroxylase